MWTQIELSNVSYIIFKVDLCPFIQKRLDRSGMPVLRGDEKGSSQIPFHHMVNRRVDDFIVIIFSSGLSSRLSIVLYLCALSELDFDEHS